MSGRFFTLLKNRKKKNSLWTVLLCLIVLAGCKPVSQDKRNVEVEVGVVPARLMPVVHSKDYVVRTNAVKSVNLEARVQGYLVKRTFREGEFVKKGQLLFEIESSSFEIAVDKARAQLASDKAKALATRNNLKRANNLLEKKLISQETHDGLVSKALQDDASVKMAEAALRQAELDLTHTRIIAPFDGMIGKANYDVGSLVGPGGSSYLARVTSINPIHVSYQIGEKELLELFPKSGGMDKWKKQLDFVLKLSDGAVYPAHGTLDFVSPVVNSDTDTSTLRVSFPNPDGILRPGMYATMTVYELKKQVLPVIPDIALQQGEQGSFVYVVKNGIASAVNIVLGDMAGENGHAVLKGLKKDDLVVVEGFMNIHNGSKVKANRVSVNGDKSVTATERKTKKNDLKPAVTG